MSDLHELVHGRVWKFGDSIDTNQLAGGGIQGANPQETLRLNCFRGLRPEFAEKVKPGDIVVAGTNFGCGSSRQTAVDALQLSGVAAVLVESVARIIRRNAIAGGLPIFVVPGISAAVEDGDDVVVDYENGIVRNTTRNVELTFAKLPPGVEAIYEAGGLLQVLARRLKEQGIAPVSA